ATDHTSGHKAQMTCSPPRATPDVLQGRPLGGDELALTRTAKRPRRTAPTVTIVLTRLERAGWATSQWQGGTHTTRPRRRYYQLHPDYTDAARALIDTHR